VIENHVELSVQLIADAPHKEAVLEAILHHHERWDGLGYPRGIAAEAIPITGRILAVADVYSALTTDRPYRHRMTSEGAADWIRSQANTQFDPRVVEALFAVISAGEDFQLPARQATETVRDTSAATGPGRPAGPATRRGPESSPAGPRMGRRQ
jgi:HD-GYP domain-containing protein (c-di-GMP phosphodiesterase class II)